MGDVAKRREANVNHLDQELLPHRPTNCYRLQLVADEMVVVAREKHQYRPLRSEAEDEDPPVIVSRYPKMHSSNLIVLDLGIGLALVTVDAVIEETGQNHPESEYCS